VAIVNLGPAGAALGAVNLNTAARGKFTPRSAPVASRTLSGNVLFNDNQCLLDVALEPPAEPEQFENFLPPAILIVSLDDVGFQDNQCDCSIGQGFLPVATVILSLWSQRAVSNRFKETPGRAFFSALTFALMNMTAHNQSNHCLWVVGPWLKQDQPNHVLANVLSDDFCPAAARRLTAVLQGLAG
jgi:hypothetical protein